MKGRCEQRVPGGSQSLSLESELTTAPLSQLDPVAFPHSCYPGSLRRGVYLDFPESSTSPWKKQSFFSKSEIDYSFTHESQLFKIKVLKEIPHKNVP